MPTQISVRSLSKSYGDRLVLDAVTCAFPVGERTGVIGENGSGKSTLLRLLAGQESPDQGEVVVTAEGGVGYLAQDTELPQHLTVQQAIDAALADLRAIEARMRHLEATMADGDESGLAEYGHLLTIFELRGGYDADARVEAALHGLGLGGLPRDRALGALSGGEQVRLRLAGLLAAAPEVLLLDEPTNHLDDNALAWLESHLRARRGTTVAVSHDRVFLDQVATTLVEVDADRRTVARHGTGYSGFLAEKAAARQRWVQAREQWEDDVARLREAVATTARRVAPNRPMTDRNKMAYDRASGRVQQSLASRVRNAEERLRRLLDAPVPPPPQPLRFTPSLHASQVTGVVLDAVDVAVAGRLAPTSLTVDAGDRLLLTGPNGAGKSTLLRVLVGDLEPDSGHVARRGRIGYLAQDVPAGAPGETVLTAFARGRGGLPEEHAERLLSLGLFGAEQLTAPVSGLSTGQRQRLALARLVTEPVDVLVLDEPSNHLSLALVEELEKALEHYRGALVVVSHDRRLRQRWRGSQLSLHPADGRRDADLRSTVRG
ncbi:macrolide transport system ATP-binding/permease protein [Streptoalloteichus tenebrarius]|uniref:Macrolide transport system ATP-binding/permease protein n=1 Tax=Streptoalloteichus tenebrarius (strain ATCC 17920 / DSM 40477 / JCM 4838 / CBS 697.72 / NBRC 16177 / NCIMB 11028 / NRRL B-12390 / A12253. 1 / ISP 5477) TaxID=1933 RepID=A0ABT1I162_STRSD|nr:ABC-F family ATP-binding cassette domain-containing protein [Streptoalloteichus tenebrarius]MCP2261528.1 macrolide transport system ATP-binding/permease protein [Streptoalloteichus tenebrarius]BFE99312.1 ABC-F family ATP-binding cassette domain-containing protein [Streptoalloteichus tenebrarius]